MYESLCEVMQVVVLMGGLGTRLGIEGPKTLADVHGTPFFQYQLDLMIQAGFKHFVFCVGHGAKAIEEYFGNGEELGIDITYSYDGDELLGTGGAIKKALPLLWRNFMVIYGDSFMDVNYFAIIQKFFNSPKRALMTIIENRNGKLGINNVIYKNDKIVAYDKKHSQITMHYIDYGISIFCKDIFEFIKKDKFDLSEIQNQLAKDDMLESYVVYNRFYEIGSPESLQQFKSYAKGRWLVPHKAIFLDRDGVINYFTWNENTEQIQSPLKEDDVELKSDIIWLRDLQYEGYLLFIVTNQPAAAKDYTNYLQLCKVNDYIVQKLRTYGINIIESEICPHYPYLEDGGYFVHECNCRKPKPGMIFDIMNKYNIDTENSWMVGDAYTDVECGQRAGVKTAFLGNFKCDGCSYLKYHKPNIICKDLKEFVEKLKEEDNGFRRFYQPIPR